MPNPIFPGAHDASCAKMDTAESYRLWDTTGCFLRVREHLHLLPYPREPAAGSSGSPQCSLLSEYRVKEIHFRLPGPGGRVGYGSRSCCCLRPLLSLILSPCSSASSSPSPNVPLPFPHDTFMELRPSVN